MTASFYMDAMITPARSLSRRGRWIVVGISAVLGFAPVIGFSILTRSPFLLPFTGLDIAGLAFAMWWIARKVTAERVRVSRSAVEVLRDGAVVWRSPTNTTRIEPLFGAIRLTTPGRNLMLARDLSPHERAEFGAALQLAVIAATAPRA
jgi:uncharacterized membrane protein